MAIPALALAKARFTAGILRPDAILPSAPKEAITEFHSLLDAALVQCSPTNIQV
jgi:hypothetical protein